MWSKIVSWLLAAITALLNGFGLFKTEYVPYSGDAGYQVQEEAVDYYEMRSWYVQSYRGDGDMCKVERFGNTGSLNRMGFYYIVAGVPHNPDARLEFSEDAIIIAPSRCKVVTQPDTAGNKIVVQCDASDYTAFKMEIINPKKWFCCMNSEPRASGNYMHSLEDHRITLQQGDTIAVADVDTTVNLWRGNAQGVLAKCETLREFLLYTDNEQGDSSQIVSGGTEQLSNSPVPGVPNASVWEGATNWVWSETASRWWMGENTEGGFPHDQYASVNDQWYYFDTEGYAVTGWASDGHYYYTKDFLPEGNESMECAMARNTIVPREDGQRYVMVGNDGLVTDVGGETVNVGTSNIRTYQREEDGTYRLISDGVANDNSDTGSDISPQEGQDNTNTIHSSTITDEQWQSILDGEVVELADGWYTNPDSSGDSNDLEWAYVVGGQSITVSENYEKSFSNGCQGYVISGVMYLFYPSGILFTDVDIVDDYLRSYYNRGSLGLHGNGWYQDENDDELWYYTDGEDYGALYSDENDALREGDVFYVFNEDCSLNVDDEVVIHRGHTYELRDEPFGSRDRIE